MGANQFLDAEGLNAYDKALKAQLQSPESAGIEVYNPEEYTLLADSKKMSNTLFFVTPDASVEYVPPLLKDASWSLISRLSEKGTFGKYYKVGDTKTFKLNGTFAQTYNDVDAVAIVAGIDHNLEIESPGEHRVHWLFAPVNDNSMSFYKSAGGFRLDTRIDDLNWNSLDFNSRYFSPDGSQYIGNIIPLDLKNILKPVYKYAYTSLSIGETEANFGIIQSLFTVPSITELGDLRTDYPYEILKSPTYELFSLNKFPYNIPRNIWTRTRQLSGTSTSYGVCYRLNTTSNLMFNYQTQTTLNYIIPMFFT